MNTLARSKVAAMATAMLFGLALMLAGCGGGGDDASPDTTEPDGDAVSAEVAADEVDPNAFPVTVETAYGPITVEQRPERIVALSGAYIDMLAALDEQPIAFIGTPRGGDDLLAGYPWFESLDLDMSGHDLRLAENYTPSLEAIAAYEPDLILGNAADNAISESMYQQMSLIAPTYTSPHGYEGWAEQVMDVGALTGHSARAAEVVAEVEVEFEAAREQLAGLQGATFVVADLRDQGASLYGTHLLFQNLGLVPDTELASTGMLSLENIDQLDPDVLNIMTFRGDSFERGATRTQLESDPRFAELPAAKNGTVVWADAAMVNAVADIGPHSFRWWLDQVIPQLKDSALNTSDGG